MNLNININNNMSNDNTDINEEDIMYKIIKIDDVENYKCVYCDFYSKHKNSLIRHQNKKNICYIEKDYKCEICNKIFDTKFNLKKHLNKKNKCNNNVVIETDSNSVLKNDNELEILKKKLEDEFEKNKELENTINNIKSERDNNDMLILISNYYAELLLEKQNEKRKSKYNLEFNILRTSLFTYSQKDCKTIKEQIYLLMDIIEFDDVEKILIKIKTEKKEYIDIIINYYEDLKKIDSNKIYGKSKLSYIKHLQRKIFEHFNIEVN
jgi:hypothetical protein